jgi:hypothetical protein
MPLETQVRAARIVVKTAEARSAGPSVVT